MMLGGPISARREDAPEVPESASILVVDDRPGNLMSLVEILHEDGRTIATASSGNEALRILMQRDFSVVLLDVNMPGMDGFEVAKMIRERPRSAHTPIIFVTAISMEDQAVHRGYSFGAVDYIFTPIVPEILRAKVSVLADLHAKTKRLEASLRERQASEARYRALFDDSPVPLWEIDLSTVKANIDRLTRAGVDLREHFASSGAQDLLMVTHQAKLVQVNRATLEMCEADDEEQVRNHVANIFGTDPIEVLREPILALAYGHTTTEGEAVLHTIRGSTKHVNLRFSVLPGHERDWTKVVVSSTDIAELHKQRAELARSNKELQQFAYVASHDLRAPLRAIDSLSEWLEKDLEAVLGPDQREQMSLMRGRVRRMDRLLGDLLEYARAGGEEAAEESVDVGKLLAEVIELANVPQGFTIEVVPPTPVFETAKVPLTRVLMNLLGNAIKHHDSQEGRVSIAVENTGDFFRFSVTDDGPGIPPRFHEKIFQMFQTLRPRDAVEGSGMGLALVRKIVESAGGSIWLTSEGRGTTFTFTWPRRWGEHGTARRRRFVVEATRSKGDRATPDTAR
ncbi:diguanylate cyclase/phosphodiesterase (GGDEF & EAL domains) with PAS/PAC sensor(s) [Labilithrix luteola]|uniref:histidine kinase n=2 Tax=Labilithrix luteola TaxID=1391654 RepID=A0A0K1QBQ5_9BACT|nr:diguanylate cyclase/phosphodiesterase (GGDEF & EAL domains) with PAS/PAC sensor(s) [Labilithrix luteola]